MLFNKNNLTLRHANLEDASAICAICAIYNFYVLHAPTTFEEVVVITEDMQQRIMEITQNFPWLVPEIDRQVLGYAYANKFGTRSAYCYSAEGSIYLHAEVHTKGIG